MQAIECKQKDFGVSLRPRMAVDLGPELQWFARGMWAIGPRVQHGSAVAKTRDTFAVEQVRIDAGDLRRHIGPDAKRLARQLVDQFACAQAEIAAGAAQQRINIFDQRGRNELETVGSKQIQQAATQLFDAPSLRGKNIRETFRQQPITLHDCEIRR